ncbi:hypothetical protein GQ457_15G007730 [Hibiscus cannabinus]
MGIRYGGGPVRAIGKRQSDLKKFFKLAVRSLLTTCSSQVSYFQIISKFYRSRARTSPPAFYSGLLSSGLSLILINLTSQISERGKSFALCIELLRTVFN